MLCHINKKYNKVLLKLMESKDFIDIDCVKASAIDKVFGYMCDCALAEPGTLFLLRNLDRF